jgi:hypothetical protein
MRRLLVLALILAGCKSSVVIPISTTSTSTTVTGPEVVEEGTTEADPWVVFEAEWMCDLVRSSYPDLQAVEVALSRQLVGAGLDRAGYDAFKAELAADEELRGRVLSFYLATCPKG